VLREFCHYGACIAVHSTGNLTTDMTSTLAEIFAVLVLSSCLLRRSDGN